MNVMGDILLFLLIEIPFLSTVIFWYWLKLVKNLWYDKSDGINNFFVWLLVFPFGLAVVRDIFFFVDLIW